MEPTEERGRSAYDWAGGLVIAAVGLYVAWEAFGYGVGTLRRMGPGFFPLAAGLLLTMLGGAVALLVREVEPDGSAMRWRAALAIFASLIAWALLLNPLGFVPATMALVVIAAAAHPAPNPKRVLATLVLLPVIGWLLFLKGLGIPVQAFAFWGP